MATALRHREIADERLIPSEAIRISVFDLDRTLTRLPTYSPFLLHAALHRAPARLLLLPLLLPDALRYAAGRLPRARMKERMHRLLAGRLLPRREAMRLAEAFADRILAGGVYPQAIALIAAEKAEGRRVILATAAPRFYAEVLARRLEIAEVVATDSVWRGDHLLPAIDGENCYGEAKRAMLLAHLRARGIGRGDAHLRFYSDDASDLPTFELSDEAIAINPSRRLREIAAGRGWPIRDWRA
jgi:HAD superfamily hydrolase (TIGR01490 family)